MIGRIVIDDVRPRTPDSEHPAKAVLGEVVSVSADVFRDGHSQLAAKVSWGPSGPSEREAQGPSGPSEREAQGPSGPSEREAQGPSGRKARRGAVMRDLGNDRWEAVIEPSAIGSHDFVVEAWTDRFATWLRDLTVKLDAGLAEGVGDVSLELREGAGILASRARQLAKGDRRLVSRASDTLADEGTPLKARLAAAIDPVLGELLSGVPDPVDLTTSRPFDLWVDRERALVGAWYELFPRSEGGFAAAAETRLPAIAAMGFDVVYLPPVHPIGHSHRKGRDNTLDLAPDDPGSPWAIGSSAGGHTAVDPGLGTLDDFDQFVRDAAALGMEVALDYALQCSPDHPWVTEHPEWFHHRPDGTIRYADNPPKKYQDIYPINFWPDPPEAREALWDACRDILEFWIARGVGIFRVDNPHTKPLAFWEWVIPDVQARHPEVIFLAEAFTRPKTMAKLAEVGFSQSYTYFTWRTHKSELIDYLKELSHGPKADYMRPSFWPNTPDILGGPLRRGPRPAFEQRLVLAATMVPTYGIYSGYELCENEPASDANEEYLHSEKYEIKRRDWSAPHSLAPLVTLLNRARRRHPALGRLRNIHFHGSGNDQILVYSKHTADGADVVLVIVNLDPHRAHEDTLQLDLGFLGLPSDAPYHAHDELNGTTYTWRGPNPYVRLDPAVQPAHVLHLYP